MQLISIAQIKIPPNRQRREFDERALQELSTSIASNGLLQPIVVRPDSATGDRWLVCGERRLRAVQQLHFLGKGFKYAGAQVQGDLVPAVDVGELDEIAAFEAELEENLRRVDLTWQEKATALAQLASLRGKQAVAAGREPPKPADLAREIYPQAADKTGADLGGYREAVRRDLIVAQHLADPEVKAAKTVEDAYKVLKRKEDVRRNTELAATIGATFTADLHKVLNTDCIAWMQAAPADQFDVICSDPMYGMGADKFGDSGGLAAGAHAYDDSYDNWKKTMLAFAPLSYKVCKPQSHMYLFCDFDRYHELKEMLEAEGWQVFRTPLIWVKPGGSRLPWVDFGPQRKYELCLYANKGRKPVTRIFPDVVSYNPDDNLGHNAQKPVALYVDLLRRSVAPGNRVLDPFAGSGPVLPACHELKCEATAIELAPASFAICVKRIEALKAQGQLPLAVDTKALLAGLK
jgi:ParB-like chromosome segregation protein Spo0J/DNA modification methylase